MRTLSAGDCIVYRVHKVSQHPTPRAKELYPSRWGETYSYVVDKYWTVSAVPDDQTIEVVTRRGKIHHLDVSDPNLRKASRFERLRLRERFPKLSEMMNLRSMRIASPWQAHDDNVEREVFLFLMLMGLIAVMAIVWHLARLH